MFAKQGARGQQRQPQMNQNPFGSLFSGGGLMPPPPQMMFMAPPPPMFMNPQLGFRPPGFQMQPAGFGFQPGFQQPMQPTFIPQNNFRPPMPGPTYIAPNNNMNVVNMNNMNMNRPPPPQNQGFGFNQPPQQGFGFNAPQQPRQQPQQPQQQGFGFNMPSINLGQNGFGVSGNGMGFNINLGF